MGVLGGQRGAEEGLGGRGVGEGILAGRAVRRGLDAVFRREGGDRGGAGEGVEAAVAAGRGGQRAGAGDRQEADLAGAAGGAPAQGAVQDDGGAGAVAEPEQDEGVVVAGRALALLGEGGEVDLVLQQDRYGRAGPQPGDDGGVPGGDPVGAAEPPGGRVDQAGGADRDGVRTVGARRGEGRVHRGERGGNGGAGGVVRGDGGGAFGAYPAQEVGDRDGDAVRAQIEADEVGAVGDDAVEPGVGSAPLGAALADHGDQSGLLEALDEVRDGRPGQSSHRLELTSRQWPVALQKLQGESVVDQSCGGRGGGTAGGRRARWVHGGILSPRGARTLIIRQGS